MSCICLYNPIISFKKIIFHRNKMQSWYFISYLFRQLEFSFLFSLKTCHSFQSICSKSFETCSFMLSITKSYYKDICQKDEKNSFWKFVIQYLLRLLPFKVEDIKEAFHKGNVGFPLGGPTRKIIGNPSFPHHATIFVKSRPQPQHTHQALRPMCQYFKLL